MSSARSLLRLYKGDQEWFQECPLEVSVWRRVRGWCYMIASLWIHLLESRDSSQNGRKLFVNVSREAEDTANCEDLLRAEVMSGTILLTIAL
jgi:hypothetical protein